MSKPSFDQVSDQYAGKAAVQRNAAGRLIQLVALTGTESVLDVGCGPGHITAQLASLTSGRVVGVDVSAAMVEEAAARFPQCTFRHIAAEALDYDGDFDVVFCNSTFQWFADAERATAAMARALLPGGRMVISCPGTAHYSPFFERVVAGVFAEPQFAPMRSHWRSPWFWLPDERAYREFFERHSLVTEHLSIEHERNESTVQSAYDTFAVGASVGYVSPGSYDCELPADYAEAFRKAAHAEMEKLASGGKVVLDFNRFYYLGRKP